jgi:hypothetical protein
VVHGASGQSVQPGLLREAARDALEEIRGVHAIVVGECDQVRADLPECNVACPRKASPGTEALDRQRGVRANDVGEAVVVVLVD